MKSKKSKWSIIGLILLMLIGTVLIYWHTRTISVKEVVQIARDAYIYATAGQSDANFDIFMNPSRKAE